MIPVARNDFQNAALCVDAASEFQYLEKMDSELSSLEERLAQLVQRMRVLREENRDLRQQLATRTDESARIGEKLQAAKTRIEALLKQIPETET